MYEIAVNNGITESVTHDIVSNQAAVTQLLSIVTGYVTQGWVIFCWHVIGINYHHVRIQSGDSIIEIAMQPQE